MLQAKEGAPFPVAPGVTLVVSPNLFGTGEPFDPIVDKIRTILSDLLREACSDESDSSRDA